MSRTRCGLPPFQGGAAGYLAYDWGRVLERLPAPRHEDLALPDVVFGMYDWVLAWDHEQSRAWLISTGLPETDRRRARAGRPRGRPSVTAAQARPAAARLGRRDRHARHGAPAAPPAGAVLSRSTTAGGIAHLALRSSFTHADYLDAVARVREYIFAGDIFQANLSQRFEAPLGEPTWALYRRLRTRNAAPFAAYLDFPDGVVLSASPERFLRVDIDGHVETRPIKGTRPRGVGPEHDAALGLALAESAKDQAENLMIVDLMRNDLSRVCAPGTVRVAELFALEHYATVHHLVSTVVGDLAPGVGRARPAARGVSRAGRSPARRRSGRWKSSPSSSRRSGASTAASIGYWSVTGALDSSIAIRTALAVAGRVYFSAGGGIVADSDPEQEYRETLDKARGMIDASGRATA